jgi:hypothetical protein
MNEKQEHKERKEKRFSICETCPKYKMGLCMECGCIIKFKIMFKNACCPLKKW